MPLTYSFSTTNRRGVDARLLAAVLTAAAASSSVIGAPEIVAELPPVGILAAEVPSGVSGIAFPLIQEELFTGQIASNTVSSVTFADSNSSARNILTPGARYYLEVLSGPFEGERLDIDTAETLTADDAHFVLDLRAASFSTIHALGADALASARCAIRAHVTLAALPALFTPPLTGSNNPSAGDAVQILGPSGFVSYYLRADGQTWRRNGSTADMRDVVIPPDVSVLLRLQSGPKTFAQTGAVRTNAFRTNLAADVQAFATGFPVNLSPADLNAVVDPSLPSTARWTGSNNPVAADSLLTFSADTGTFQTHYLRGDGASWFQLGGAGTDLSTDAFVRATGLTLLQRQHADAGFLILPPFDL